MAKPRISAGDPWDGIRIAMLYAAEFPCRPQWEIPPQKVSHAGLFLFVRGSGWHEIDGQRFDGSPGRLMIMQSGQETSAGHDPNDPITVLSLGFQLSGPEQADAMTMLHLPRSMQLADRELAEVDVAMRQVIDGYQSTSVRAKLAARGALLALLAHLAEMSERLDESRVTWGPSGQGSRDPRIEAVCQHIDQHLADAHTLADLAQVAHLSAAHFGAVFREVMGLSPLAYVRRRRIEAAKVMLAQGRDTVEAVARAVGFDDPYHFSRVFRRTVGIPPSTYAASIKRPFNP